MEKISIKTGAVNIFRTATASHQNTETKHSNPFGLSFKGNVLQADVFSSSKTKNQEKTGFVHTITEKGRAVKSAIVGGINNFNTELNTRFNNGINRIVSFGRRIGEGAKSLWQKANETHFVWDFNGLSNGIKDLANKDIKEIVNPTRGKQDLSHHTVGELETMLKEELEIRE